MFSQVSVSHSVREGIRYLWSQANSGVGVGISGPRSLGISWEEGRYTREGLGIPEGGGGGWHPPPVLIPNGSNLLECFLVCSGGNTLVSYTRGCRLE